MSGYANVILDAEGEAPHVFTDVVGYAFLDADGHLSDGRHGAVNPRVFAHALQYVVDECNAEADRRGIPPLDESIYPRREVR